MIASMFFISFNHRQSKYAESYSRDFGSANSLL